MTILSTDSISALLLATLPDSAPGKKETSFTDFHMH